jgi:alkylhydroperoxidase family enzyme
VRALGDDKLVQAILDDYHTAPIEPKLRTMLAFLEKLTLTPDQVTEADAAALREAGIDAEAAESALYVGFVFGVMDRLADAFDFKVNDERGLKWVARILYNVGYTAGCVPG